MYAVVELQGHQYIVSQGWEIIVDKLNANKGDKISTKVLALFTDDAKQTTLWTPFVANASVEFEVKDHQKWKKINVLKFKRKNRYEKHYWHRSHQTILTVNTINDK